MIPTAIAAEISPAEAVIACAAMAALYVGILYSPMLVLRLPPPTSLESFFIRRFACAAVSSLLSVITTAVLLRVYKIGDVGSILLVFGIRTDHMWQAVVYPVLLTSLLYAGSIISKLWLVVYVGRKRREIASSGVGINNVDCIVNYCWWILDRVHGLAQNIMTWRNLVVAPITEELVFRGCMIPLLLCGGFKTYNIIFFSPVFFSLAGGGADLQVNLGEGLIFTKPFSYQLVIFAHLNHLMELYLQQNYNFAIALRVVGLQLGYTVVFGWYASFLFIRTGNIISPISAHIFCNMMGLPVLSSPRTKGMASIAFATGFLGFFFLLFPMTNSRFYSERTENCSCWHGYCRQWLRD